MLAAAALLACAVAVPLASDHQILDAQVSAHSIALDDDIGDSLSALADAAAMLLPVRKCSERRDQVPGRSQEQRRLLAEHDP